MMSNTCAVLYNKRDLRLENRSSPVCGPNDVLIQVGFVGLCGSDLHQWADGYIGEKKLTVPFVLGHEASGTVVEIGRNVQDNSLNSGDKVALEPGISCRFCDFCKNGRYNLCPKMRFFSTLQPPSDGVLCRFKSHPANLCFKLPELMSLEEGALIEPLSVAVHACNRAELNLDSNVLICGAGPIGVLCALVCNSMGISKITVTDVNASRLKFAEKIIDGCRTINVDQTKWFKEPFLPSAAIECTGVGVSQSIAIRTVKPGSTVVLVGLGRPEAKLPVSEVSAKELTIRGVFRYANCYPTAIDLVTRGLIDLKPLITNKFRLTETEKALMTAIDGNCMKVLIQCSDSDCVS